MEITRRSSVGNVVPRASRMPAARGWQWTKTRGARNLFSWCRKLHVYVSTALFALLIFFCLTGITLNHPDWFEGQGQHQIKVLAISPDLSDLLMQAEPPSVPVLEAYIQETTGLEHPRSIDIDREEGTWIFDYPLPAGYASVMIDSVSQELTLEHQMGSMIALMEDLHKGRHTGAVWSVVIDVSAGLIIFLAITGMVLVFQQARWRLSGLVLALLGLIGPWLVYALWAPGPY